GRPFTDLYNVQHLASNRIDQDAKVVITTIQRLYAMLRGEELSEEDEEASAFEVSSDGEKRTVVYNPAIPIETFDFIVTDECHRSIYGTWRQVLEYFDAFIIGLTATPTKHTLGFFRQNLVSEYPEERSVADGINVAHEIYRVKTLVSEKGSTVEAGYTVGARDKRTRKVRYAELDDDLTYTAPDIDRSVTVPNQIRTILETYKQRLFTELFPGREHVPKTLIFAKDDHHAEEIVLAAREVFGKGNDFAKKITYKAEGVETLIKEFRTSLNPRIAVTVDMIATGTDIKPLEVLIFMRDVKSETYYEQMKGRAIRSILADDLRQVTPDADAKTRFLLIDAVGVTEGTKKVSRPMERKRTVAFGKLLELIAQGDRSEDTLSSTAARLAALDKKLNDDDRARIAAVASGLSLRDLANGLLDAIDPDKIEAETKTRYGSAASDQEAKAVIDGLKEEARCAFDDPALRKLLTDLKQQSEIVIDDITTDETTYAGFDVERAREMTGRFRQFIEENKDELLALQILYSRPYGSERLTYQALQDLALALKSPPWHLLPASLWTAYWRLDASRVRQAKAEELLTDLIALVRYAVEITGELVPFRHEVEQKFNLWIGRKLKAGRSFSEDEMDWLRLIKDHIAANAEMQTTDFEDMPQFQSRGGTVKARKLFGTEVNEMLTELNEALVG
ncbi:MAG: type I restriction-modification enzyme R subunit C-terminal domain-containing protein, partial [Rhodomicrobiaceae bacterium]